MTRAALFDSHLHLTDSRLADDREAVLARAREAGVREMVTVGTDPEDARQALRLAAADEGIWASAGLHPHDALRFSEEILSQLAALAEEPRVVAIGETGLDFFYDNSPRTEQLECFRAQMGLAEGCGLPVIVHSREADAETAQVLSEFAGRVSGVLHCFTGGAALLEAGLEAGWYVSFSGIATFAGELEESVRRVPEDRLLIETDSPYLAPVPKRGRRNEPAFLPFTCDRVAAIRGIASEELAASTRSNALRFYQLTDQDSR